MPSVTVFVNVICGRVYRAKLSRGVVSTSADEHVSLHSEQNCICVHDCGVS